MITPKECYLTETCKKFLNNNCTDELFCPRLTKIDFYLDEAGLSGKNKKSMQLYIDEDGTDREEFINLKKIEKDIENFVKSGRNLYLHSSTTGNGKSSWSMRMIQSYIHSVWFKEDTRCIALYINVPRFVIELKNSISQQNEYVDHIRNNFLNADLVVWDEIGVKTLTQFEYDNLLQMINTRIDMGKCNIYTSNAAPEEIKEKMGDRLYSRICKGAIDIELHGKDKRSLTI